MVAGSRRRVGGWASVTVALAAIAVGAALAAAQSLHRASTVRRDIADLRHAHVRAEAARRRSQDALAQQVSIAEKLRHRLAAAKEATLRCRASLAEAERRECSIRLKREAILRQSRARAKDACVCVGSPCSCL